MCLCERFIYSHDRSAYFAAEKYVDRSWEYINCDENPIYVFPEAELCGLSPNFHIHVSMSDLYILTIGVPILLQENMWSDPRNI